MEKVKGCMTMVRNAGTAEVILVQSRCDASPIIMAPTSTSTGEVVKGGRAWHGGIGRKHNPGGKVEFRSYRHG